MFNHYGPTIVLGLMISSAVIFDDLIIASMYDEHHPGMKHAHLVKNKTGPIHAEKVLEMTEHQTVGSGAHRLVVRVNGENADFPSEGVERAIRSAIDTADKEGRTPTPQELDEAIQSATQDLGVEDLDIRIEIDN